MKVVIDARMVTAIPHGFSRYVSRLAEGLSQVRASVAGLPYEPVFLVSSGEGEFHGFETQSARSAFLNPRELIEIPRLLRELGAALYHSPTFSSLLHAPCPWIQTVHDLNHLQFGGTREKLYYRFLLKPFARRARVLATVSEFSQKEIAKWLELESASIEVIHNAIEPPPRLSNEMIRKTLSDFGLQERSYFLCLSNAKPHKNLALLADAFARHRAGPSAKWPLVVSVRGLPETEGLIQAGPIGNEAGQALVAAAGAVVFPSIYEGFGLPPVEAASQGIPILVSDIAPHREGLRDLRPEEARWVNPLDKEGWSAAFDMAERGHLTAPSPTSAAAILERYSILALGRSMDRLYRRVLGLSA